jgi:glycosyltransferase 2 family protein
MPGKRACRVLKLNGRAAEADDSRSHGDLQAMKQARVEETRDRDTSAFHEQATKASSAKFSEHVREVEAPAVQPSRNDLHVIRQTLVTVRMLSTDDEHGPSVVLSNDASIVRDPTLRIENDPHGAITRHETRREPRVIHFHRRRTDDDGVEQCAHSMRVPHVFRTRNERRSPAWRRNTSVEALAQVSDADLRAHRSNAKRQVEVE